MANETTTPLLPCAGIDEIVPFYEALGFRMTYRQRRPNGYAIVVREDLQLHFFALDGFVPADSYGSCLVGAPDAGELGDSKDDLRAAAALLGKALARTEPTPPAGVLPSAGVDQRSPGDTPTVVLPPPATESSTMAR
jgi:hypothetical protein